jgi:hypothetical protein
MMVRHPLAMRYAADQFFGEFLDRSHEWDAGIIIFRLQHSGWHQSVLNPQKVGACYSARLLDLERTNRMGAALR